MSGSVNPFALMAKQDRYARKASKRLTINGRDLRLAGIDSNSFKTELEEIIAQIERTPEAQRWPGVISNDGALVDALRAKGYHANKPDVLKSEITGAIQWQELTVPDPFQGPIAPYKALYASFPRQYRQIGYTVETFIEWFSRDVRGKAFVAYLRANQPFALPVVSDSSGD